MIEVDTTLVFLDVEICNHLIDGRVLRFKTKALHSCFKFFGVNEARTVSIKKVESFSDFFNLVLSEAWAFEGFTTDG